MSPAAAILVVDFWLLRKQRWNIPDLYIPEGIYWFQYGLNWRAFGRSFCHGAVVVNANSQRSRVLPWNVACSARE
jgi:cytosine/uracil/thiamine/allantoin permease